MNNNNHNKINLESTITDFKNVKMDAFKKAEIKNNLMSQIKGGSTHTASPSPYNAFMMPFEKIGKVAFISMFVLASGTAFASQGALPGSALYPIKTKIVEPAIKYTQLSKSAQIKYEAQLADKRLSEMTELVALEQATPEIIAENQALFNESVAQVASYNETNGQARMVQDKSINLDATISAYYNLIASVGGATDGINAVSATAASVVPAMATTSFNPNEPVQVTKIKVPQPNVRPVLMVAPDSGVNVNTVNVNGAVQINTNGAPAHISTSSSINVNKVIDTVLNNGTHIQSNTQNSVQTNTNASAGNGSASVQINQTVNSTVNQVITNTTGGNTVSPTPVPIVPKVLNSLGL